ncbi:MAG: BrnT family toxin [Treponema sp.]|nr:BrnT family toxin [Treponema sp.]
MPIFTWDENKNLANIKKHGVDFNDAVRAWYDFNRIDFFDDEHSSAGETRWTFLGSSAGTVLFVVETEPDKETVRIISARKALKHEQEVYYGNRG